MPSGRLPHSVDARRLAERAGVLDAALPVASTRRLAEAVGALLEPVQVRLEFALDGLRRPVVSGHIEARVSLVCQRCLGDMETSLRAEPRWLVAPFDAPQVQAGYEAIGANEDALDLVSLVEDELLLALPMVPRHALAECATQPGSDAPPRKEGSA